MVGRCGSRSGGRRGATRPFSGCDLFRIGHPGKEMLPLLMSTRHRIPALAVEYVQMIFPPLTRNIVSQPSQCRASGAGRSLARKPDRSPLWIDSPCRRIPGSSEERRLARSAPQRCPAGQGRGSTLGHLRSALGPHGRCVAASTSAASAAQFRYPGTWRWVSWGSVVSIVSRHRSPQSQTRCPTNRGHIWPKFLTNRIFPGFSCGDAAFTTGPLSA